MNVIDVGCSNIRSYLIQDGEVVSLDKCATQPNSVINDTLHLFRKQLGQSQATFVISTSDSIAWEDKDGNVQWIEHSVPDAWMNGLTPYAISGHPKYTLLRGAANQMLSLVENVGLGNIRRILPLSAMIAAQIAGDREWNVWDYTHASNSGFYNHAKGKWADEAKPFIDAGVIGERILSPVALIPADPSLRRVYLGGHDSVFTAATDIPYSTKPYISFGTWTTVSVPTIVKKSEGGQIDTKTWTTDRYILAANGIVMRQQCFPSLPSEHDAIIERCFDFLDKNYRRITSVPSVRVFGGWSDEIIGKLENHERRGRYKFDHVPIHDTFGCTHLPMKVEAFVKKNDPNYKNDLVFYCEGA